MAVIFIEKTHTSDFEGETYRVDTDRRFGGYEPGDLICQIAPFFGVPLTLEIAIRADGSLIFRSWDWNGGGNGYLHTNEVGQEDFNNLSDCDKFCRQAFVPTSDQTETVNGLFSGRIKFEGLKIAPGRSLQRVCPIDIDREEQLTGKRIYLS